MLTEHGILPSVVVNIPLREKILMAALIAKQSKINKEAAARKK